MVDLPVVSLTASDIVESNPGKFRLGETELKERKDFVERTRKSVQVKLLWFLSSSSVNPQACFMFCVFLSSYEDIYSGTAADWEP